MAAIIVWNACQVLDHYPDSDQLSNANVLRQDHRCVGITQKGQPCRKQVGTQYRTAAAQAINRLARLSRTSPLVEPLLTDIAENALCYLHRANGKAAKVQEWREAIQDSLVHGISTASGPAPPSRESLWNPTVEFGLVHRNGIHCVGWASSRHRRCNNPIAKGNEMQAFAYIERLSRIDPRAQQARDLLREIAKLLLCTSWHRDQAARVAQGWAEKMQDVAIISTSRASTLERRLRDLDLSTSRASTLDRRLRDLDLSSNWSRDTSTLRGSEPSTPSTLVGRHDAKVVSSPPLPPCYEEPRPAATPVQRPKFNLQHGLATPPSSQEYTRTADMAKKALGSFEDRTPSKPRAEASRRFVRSGSPVEDRFSAIDSDEEVEDEDEDDDTEDEDEDEDTEDDEVDDDDDEVEDTDEEDEVEIKDDEKEDDIEVKHERARLDKQEVDEEEAAEVESDAVESDGEETSEDQANKDTDDVDDEEWEDTDSGSTQAPSPITADPPPPFTLDAKITHDEPTSSSLFTKILKANPTSALPSYPGIPTLATPSADPTAPFEQRIKTAATLIRTLFPDLFDLTKPADPASLATLAAIQQATALNTTHTPAPLEDPFVDTAKTAAHTPHPILQPATPQPTSTSELPTKPIVPSTPPRTAHLPTPPASLNRASKPLPRRPPPALLPAELDGHALVSPNRTYSSTRLTREKHGLPGPPLPPAKDNGTHSTKDLAQGTGLNGVAPGTVTFLQTSSALPAKIPVVKSLAWDVDLEKHGARGDGGHGGWRGLWRFFGGWCSCCGRRGC